MSYLGSWKIDDLLTFPAITHRFDTGALTDADAVPAYRVYEDETGTAILTGNMAKLDDANTTGFYSEQITLSAANGFEKGKCYTVYVSAAVNSVTGGQHHTFQIEAEVDANVVSGAVTLTNAQGYKKNTAVSKFVFPMFDLSLNPVTGLSSFTAEVSLGGAAFGAITDTVTEIGDGWYEIDLTAGEMNADEIALRFSASGARETTAKIRTVQA